MSMGEDPPLQMPSDPPSSGQDLVRELEARIAEIEAQRDFANLTAEGQQRALLIKEINQRILVRWVAIGLGITVMVFMGAVLAHATHSFFWGPFVVIPPSLAIAMFVAPTISITTITVMLTIGAFRKFSDEEVGPAGVATLAADGAKFLGSN